MSLRLSAQGTLVVTVVNPRTRLSVQGVMVVTTTVPDTIYSNQGVFLVTIPSVLVPEDECYPSDLPVGQLYPRGGKWPGVGE